MVFLTTLADNKPAPSVMADPVPRCDYCGEIAAGPERFLCTHEMRPILIHGRRICTLCENLSDTRLERLRLGRWQQALRVVQRQGLFRAVLEMAGLRIGQFLHPLMSDRMLSLFFPGEERRILPGL